MLKRIIFILISLFFTSNGFATVYYYCGTGVTWDAAASAFLYPASNCTGVPINPNSLLSTDEMVIQPGADLLVVGSVSFSGIKITIYGTLFINKPAMAGKLTLPQNTATISLEAGSNLACWNGTIEELCDVSSSQIIIGTGGNKFTYKGSDIDDMDNLTKPSVLDNTGGSLPLPTGPGGVDNSTNNEIWLRADSGVYNNAGTVIASNNDDVQEWHDNSGNNNNAVQSTASFKPQYQTNQANGFPAIDFDGSDDRLLAAGVATSGQATVLTVVRADALTNNNDGIIHAAPSGQSFSTGAADKSIGMWIQKSTAEPWGRGVQSNNNQRSISKVTSISTGSFYTITNDYDGTNIIQYINGATAGSISYDGTLKSWTDFGIGRQGSESFTGDIAEVIAYTISLNSAQLIIVHNYLKAKYGITLASNNIYTMDTPANGDYDYEVAGIGRVDASNIHDDAQGTSVIRILNPTDLGNDEFFIWGHDNGILQAIETTNKPASVQARFDRIWAVSETDASGTAVDVGSVDIRFDLTGLGPVTETDLRLLVDVDGDFSTTDFVISGAEFLGSNIYEFAGVANLQNGYKFTLATINSSQTPLPIELLWFNAVLNEGVVALSWSTATETGNDYFTVERSADLNNWEIINVVKGAGYSREKLIYKSYDENPLSTVSYYRLKQTDFDGKFTYSNIVAVSASGLLIQKIYPQPASDRLTIQLKENVNNLKIYNSQGVRVYSENAILDRFVIIDVSGFPPGIYFVTAYSEIYSTSFKIIVVR